MSPVPYADQLACVKRELALRKRVYPNWVNNGRMTPEKAHLEIAHMQAVLDTVQKVSDLADVSEEMKILWRPHSPLTPPNS